MAIKKKVMEKRFILIVSLLKFVFQINQVEYKCRHSVLFEFNHTLTEEELKPISSGTFTIG